MIPARKLLPLALAATVGACGAEAKREAEVRPVRTLVVAPKPIEDERRVVGEVRPRYESELGFRVSGKIVQRAVEVGAAVRKGDLLARLDDQDYRTKLKSADADVAAAEAVLVEAQAAESRHRLLLASGATTRANYDAAFKNMKSAEAKLDSAKAALTLAQDQIAYAALRAEFDGIVTAASAEPGQVVNVGQTVIKLARPDERDAVFAVAEAAFKERNPNVERPELIVTLLSDPRIETEGVVREVAPVADPATRTYQVRVTLKSPPDAMRFGTSVVGRLKASTRPVVVLPSGALFDKGGEPAVWVVNRSNGTVTLKLVTVERYETDKVVIAAGLEPGDVVVTAGVNRLREGQNVRLAEGGVK